MKFAVVAQRSTPANVALATAPVPGVESVLLSPAQALVHLERGHIALGRLDVLHSLDGMEPGVWALERLAARGVKVLNPPAAVRKAHNKLSTAEALESAGLPHPRTVALRAEEPVVELDLPVVVKPPYGSWGADVVLCATEEELDSCLAELRERPWFLATGAVVQELVPPLGHDLRCLVAGGRVVGAIERWAAPGEWRTNIALGGTRRPVVAPPRACELAIAAAAALGIDLVGVDLLPTGAGEYVVIELNGAVDFTHEYAADVDVFAEAVSALVGRAAADEPDEAAVASLV
ncbi:MAG TPA: RimK family alpha-L-glutamate ligase [Gaiellaceae bacterium]